LRFVRLSEPATLTKEKLPVQRQVKLKRAHPRVSENSEFPSLGTLRNEGLYFRRLLKNSCSVSFRGAKEPALSGAEGR